MIQIGMRTVAVDCGHCLQHTFLSLDRPRKNGRPKCSPPITRFAHVSATSGGSNIVVGNGPRIANCK